MKRLSAIMAVMIVLGLTAGTAFAATAKKAPKSKAAAKTAVQNKSKQKPAVKGKSPAAPSAETIAWGKAQCDKADNLLTDGECEKAGEIYSQVLQKLPASPRAKDGIAKVQAAVAAKQDNPPAPKDQDGPPAPKEKADSKNDAKDFVALADEFVACLANTDYPHATAMFNAEMKQKMSADTLKDVMAAAVKQYGELKGQVGTRKSIEQGLNCVYVTCAFEKMNLDVKVVFDKADKIAGLWLVPSK